MNALKPCGRSPIDVAVVGMVLRHLSGERQIAECFLKYGGCVDYYGTMVKLGLLCAREILRAGRELDRESLTKTLELNWRKEYSVYDNVPRVKFAPIVLPDEPEPKIEEQPEPTEGLGVEVRDGKIVVSSRQIALTFGKAHNNILRDIKNLDCSEKFRALNFEQTSETVAMPRGGTREDPICFVTRDGFTFLAMGYTGRRAAQFKEAYIERFNEMEEALRTRALPAPERQPEALPQAQPKPVKRKKFYTPEEAAELLGYRGYRTFYASMVAAGFFVKRSNGSHEPKPEFVRQGLFVSGLFRSGVNGRSKWRRPMTTEAGIMYLRRLADTGE